MCVGLYNKDQTPSRQSDSLYHTLSQFLQIGFLDLSDGTKARCPAKKLATIDMSNSGQRELLICRKNIKHCSVKDAKYLDERNGNWVNGRVSFHVTKSQIQQGKLYLLFKVEYG